MVLMCLPLMAQALAQPTPSLFPREDIYVFINKPARIAALIRGIQVMKQRPASDPTSWAFQSNIHGANANAPLWNQCQHRHWWFLAWHRAYLYYMERMLQVAAAEPRLRIPYWNYTDPNSRALPAPFLNAASVLYVPGRQLVSASDEVTPSSVNIAVAMSRINFVGSDAQLGFGGGQENAPVQFPFENKAGSLERLPHNAIHVQVGGIMQNARLAAADPVFWLHHSNIDRLWDVWLQSGQGRANPSNVAFLNATFTLYNENGQQVTHRVQDFLGDTRRFGYYYEPSPAATTMMAAARTGPPIDMPTDPQQLTVSTMAEATLEKPVQIIGEPVTIPLAPNAQSAEFQQFSMNAASCDTQKKRFLLVLDDINFEKLPTNIYELYLNLPSADYRTMSQTKYYIGALAFFEPDTLAGHTGHGAAQHKRSETFDITEVVHTLQRDQDLHPENMTVTVVPVGIMKKGQPTKPSAPVPLQVKNLKIVSLKARQEPQQKTPGSESAY